MAKQYGSYMGGFSGALGGAIGYRWNGVWCMRSRPTQVRNPRTEKQMAHRTLFKSEVQLAARMRWAVINGLRPAAREANMTPYNLFVSMNQDCFALVDGQLAVDYAGLALSAGPVAPVALADATVGDGNVLDVSFDKNPMHLSASQFDSVYLYVYAPATGQGYLTAPVYRRSKRLGVSLPDGFAGQQVHLYLMVQSERGQWSSTAYGGSLVLSPAPAEAEPQPSAPTAAHAAPAEDTQTAVRESVAPNQTALRFGPDVGDW